MNFIPGIQMCPSSTKNLRGLTQSFFLTLCVQWMPACVSCVGECSVPHNHRTPSCGPAVPTQSKATARVKSWLRNASTQKWHIAPPQLSLAEASHLVTCDFSAFHFTPPIRPLGLGGCSTDYSVHPGLTTVCLEFLTLHNSKHVTT